MMTGVIFLLAVVLYSGNGVTIEGERTVNPGRPTEITVSPMGLDLRDRFRGFAVAEDFDDENSDATHWLLTPGICEKSYRIAPFVHNGKVCGPVYFEPPAAREPVTGGIECDPEKDLPPLTWKLAGKLLAGLAGIIGLAGLLWLAIRYLARKVKEHRMSPIERAWVELDRLLAKGLPGRGRYKDFYVELTMVVRRYIQRKYGIKAPHLTTEEFLEEIKNGGKVKSEGLRNFLESADMVKFAGVKATPEMSDAATASARGYLREDSTPASDPISKTGKKEGDAK